MFCLFQRPSSFGLSSTYWCQFGHDSSLLPDLYNRRNLRWMRDWVFEQPLPHRGCVCRRSCVRVSDRPKSGSQCRHNLPEDGPVQFERIRKPAVHIYDTAVDERRAPSGDPLGYDTLLVVPFVRKRKCPPGFHLEHG